MNIYGAMNTAKWALLTHQAAIEVTGQNIANVSNPDYTKQDIQLQASHPISFGNHMIGSGVTIGGIERRFDSYLFGQRLRNNFDLSSWEARERVMDVMDILLNETGDAGINTDLGKFFLAFSNLGINPSNAVERQDVIQKGISLAQSISTVATDIKRLRRDIDLKIQGVIPEINRLSEEIVEMNIKIHETEVNGITANDFRDQREALLNDLSEFTDVTYFEQSNNELVVMLSNSRPLVIGQQSFELSTAINSSDPETSSIFWEDSSGGLTNISTEFSSGQVGQWMTLRDNDILNVLDDLDLFSASIIKDVNRLHSSGYGLDGSTGNNFFNGLTPGGRAGVNNTGNGVLGIGTVTNPESVDLAHYRFTFDGAGNYTVFNRDDSTSSGTYSFTSGGSLSFFADRGISISITGTPAAGDTFDISASFDAAVKMSMNSNVQDNTNRVAAGVTSLRGDGAMANNIADLQYLNRVGGGWDPTNATSGTYTFGDYFSSIVGGIGSSALQARSGRALQEAVSNQLSNLREQVSGVSLDEEMINLVKFQHAYGGAAKVITTVDEMLQTLLNMK